jgi:hypothetical protein
LNVGAVVAVVAAIRVPVILVLAVAVVLVAVTFSIKQPSRPAMFMG